MVLSSFVVRSTWSLSSGRVFRWRRRRLSRYRRRRELKALELSWKALVFSSRMSLVLLSSCLSSWSRFFVSPFLISSMQQLTLAFCNKCIMYELFMVIKFKEKKNSFTFLGFSLKIWNQALIFQKQQM